MNDSTEVLSASANLQRALLTLGDWAEEIHMAYAWAASDAGKATHWRALPLGKMRRALIGIQFASTEPAALRTLLGCGRHVLKVVEDTGGVFHPKLLIARRGNEAAVLLGSSNFTPGGFSGNTELNVLLRGTIDRAPIREILTFFEAQWAHPRTFEPDEDWLARYEHAYDQRPAPPRLPASRREPVRNVESADALDISWPDYVELIGRQERRTLANGWEIHIFDHPNGCYLSEIEACRDAFHDYADLRQMPPDTRKIVTGWGGGTTGYLGNMRGAGYFKQVTQTSPEALDEWLDEIPLTGPIKDLAVAQYLDGITQIHGVAFATATRLLVVKRPDLFISLNNASRERISEVFGGAPTNTAAYLRLLHRIWQMPWFQARRPADIHGQRIWDARVALLDAVMYETPAYQR